MKKTGTQLLNDKRLWAMISLVVFVAVVPPGESNAGSGVKKVDSLEYYRINTINYLHIQESLIKKLQPHE